MTTTLPNPQNTVTWVLFYLHPADEGTEPWKLSTQWTLGPAPPRTHPAQSPRSPPLGSTPEAHVNNDVMLHRGEHPCYNERCPVPLHSEGVIVDFLPRCKPCKLPIRELRIEILCIGKEKKKEKTWKPVAVQCRCHNMLSCGQHISREG